MINAQNTYLEWADGMKGTGSNEGESIISDGNGNVYITGSFEGVVDFDPGINVNNLVSKGNSDIFIEKLDSNGNLIWVVSIGGVGNDIGFSLTKRYNNSIYITGSFEDIVDFDPGGNVANLASNGSSDIFVLKLDLNGNLIWAKSIGGSFADVGKAVITTPTEVYITGSFQDTVDFDPGVNTINLTSAGSNDIFILKLNSAQGDFLMAKSMGGLGDDCGLSIANSPLTGDMYVTGFFEGTANFISNTLTSNGGKDLFLFGVDFFDAISYATYVGSTFDDIGNAITIDPSGDIIITGKGFISPDVFFVIKLNDWVIVGNSMVSEGKSITVDNNKNIYVTGRYQYSEGNLVSAGLDDVFLLKLDVSGNIIEEKSMGGAFSDIGNSIFLDQATKSIYITGSFQNNADFNPNAGLATLTGNDSSDIFAVKLNQCTNTNTSMSVTVCDSYTSPSGNYTWTTTGVYTDIVTGPVPNCTNTIIITLMVDNQINPTINNNTSPTLISNESLVSTYQWIDCNTLLPFIGDTLRNYTATTDGDYAVIITKNGCIDTSDCVTVTNVGINENEFNSVIKLYPNPTLNLLTIESDLTFENITIIDVAGQLMNLKLSEGNTFDVSDLPKGVYFIEMTSRKTIITRKFIKN